MAQNTNTIDYREDYYRGFSKVYFNKILETIIDFGDLENESGLIFRLWMRRGAFETNTKREKYCGI